MGAQKGDQEIGRVCDENKICTRNDTPNRQSQEQSCLGGKHMNLICFEKDCDHNDGEGNCKALNQDGHITLYADKYSDDWDCSEISYDKFEDQA